MAGDGDYNKIVYAAVPPDVYVIFIIIYYYLLLPTKQYIPARGG